VEGRVGLLELLIEKSFEILDQHIKDGSKVAIAYSGGKDSTCLSLLLAEWIRERSKNNIKLLIVHSDTLSEIPEMENWAREFIETYKSYIKKLGVEVDSIITTPKINETFYWRAIIRGYAAPTFTFRWCVYLLKRVPAREALSSVGNAKVLLGHRDDESSARISSLTKRGAMCPLTAGRCASYYYNIEGDVVKVYPIRSWSYSDVWSYLRTWSRRINLDKLFKLYWDGAVPARYGCWHCTLVKRQLAHYIIRDEYMYYEAARLIYRFISDLEWFRALKESGYSRLGPLTPSARAILLRVIQLAEDLSGIKLYGLDESRTSEYTLRSILYELPENKANKVINEIDYPSIKKSPERYISIGIIRDIKRHMSDLKKFIEFLYKRVETIDHDVREHVIQMIDELSSNR
jgi:DNA sulfur modification protein DndC